MLHLVSGINFLVLSVNLIPVSLSRTCLFVTPSLFHSRLKTYLFHKNLSHHRLSYGLRTNYMDCMTGPFLLSISVFLFIVPLLLFFCLVQCGRLSWLLVSFLVHVNMMYRIVSCHIVLIVLIIMH